MELRPYQLQALERIAAAEVRGVRRQLGVAATGLGKTIMFCALAQQRGERTLILAHRDELVSQAVAKVREVWPDVDVGVVKGEYDDTHAHVVVASVQTLARDRRLQRLIDAWANVDGMAAWGRKLVDPFGLVVVDEAHHAAADSYRKILDALNAGDNEGNGPLLLGVTATPDRGDGKGLDDLFDEIVFNLDLLWGIRSDYLCDVRGLVLRLDDLDLSGVKVRGGDYETGAVGRALQDAHAPTVIHAKWAEHASDRRTLVFVPTVDLSQQVEHEFRQHGIRCAHVDGTTPLDERRQILRDYDAGTVQVITNCMVLTEGFDSPRTDCIVQARPTRSRALFTQMVGRGTRKHPDKTDLLVLDVVGASDTLSLVTVPSLFGVEQSEFAAQLGDGTGTVSDVVQHRDDWLAKLGRITSEEADLFREMRGQGVAWVRVPGDRPRYERSLGNKLSRVVLVQTVEGWLAGMVEPDGKKRVLIAHVTQEMAQGVAEDAVRKHGVAHLVNADAPWRSGRPSEKSRKFAGRLRISVGDMTAGELSDAIDATLAERQQKKRGRRKASA